MSTIKFTLPPSVVNLTEFVTIFNKTYYNLRMSVFIVVPNFNCSNPLNSTEKLIFFAFILPSSISKI